MFLDNWSKFFKKNGIFLLQLAAISLPFVLLLIYFAKNPISDDIPDDVVSISKFDAVEMPAKKQNTEDKKAEESTSQAATAFEVDEISQAAIDKNLKNPQGLLPENTPCNRFDNPHVIATHTGTISKAKNVATFKKPLPAVISEIEYVCVNTTKNTKETKVTVTGVGVDAQANVLRCMQSNSDDTLSREERVKHVQKIMTHHCGFKLVEHQTVPLEHKRL